MTDAFLNVILGMVQGVTEWLPVSSDGHLVLVKKLFHVEQSLAYDTMLHMATLFVLLVYFRRDISRLMQSLVQEDRRQERQMVFYILLAVAVTVVFAIILEPFVGVMQNNARLLGIGFIGTAAAVAASRLQLSSQKLGWYLALVIGLVQAFAVLPGVSRSGLTIGIGMLLGLPREVAFRFSFLIAIPAIAGAFLYQVRHLSWDWWYVPGFLIAMVVGYVSLWFLDRLVKSGSMYLFAPYTLVVGLLLITFNP